METKFADRLWWARKRAKLSGAELAKRAGCTKSLISSIERNNFESPKYNAKFAKALKVDAKWLEEGTGKIPEGYDPKQAREGRLEMSRSRGAAVVEIEPRPSWARPAPAPQDTQPLRDAETIQQTLVVDFMDYARSAGPERTRALLDALSRLVGLAAGEVPDGKDKVRAS